MWLGERSEVAPSSTPSQLLSFSYPNSMGSDAIEPWIAICLVRGRSTTCRPVRMGFDEVSKRRLSINQG